MKTLEERAAEADELVERGRRLLVEVVHEASEQGMSQRQVAALVGRSQPEVARLLAKPPRTVPTVGQVAERMADLVAEGHEHQALRVMLDGVNRLPAPGSPAEARASLRRPASTGDSRWDALLAAAVAYRARLAGVRVPTWTAVPPLRQFWWPAGERAGRAMAMKRTPVEFKRLGIWFDERNFRTA